MHQVERELAHAQRGQLAQPVHMRRLAAEQAEPVHDAVWHEVRGRVPGLDADGFREAAETAKENCPVSKALAGVPEITLDAQFDG